MRAILGSVLVVLALHAVVLGAYVLALGGDPAVLIAVAPARAGKPPYENITSAAEQDGYDGQFQYALARAPWQRHDAGLDIPATRHLRILYPALAWLLSGGDPDRLVLVLPLINLLAIGGLAALGAVLARRQGMSPWWGMLLPVALNVAMPALRDLTDVVSTLAVCGLVTVWLTRTWWCLGPCAGAALLAREQNVAVVLLILAGTLWCRRWSSSAGLAAALALWGGWVAVVWQLYGRSPFPSASYHFGPPFLGMGEGLMRLREMKVSTAIYHLLNLSVIVGQIGLTVWLVRRKADPVLVGMATGGACMALLGTAVFYQDFWAYTRVFVLLPLGTWLASLQLRWRSALAALGSAGILPLAFVCKIVLNRLLA